MKITPLEIRQKDFEKKLRGYDKDEVNAFLQSLSNEWERVLEENKELTIKLAQAEKEVEKLREVESSLYKTLKTAEDTGANVIEQANKAAELHMKETKMNAEALLSESKNRSRAMIEQAEMEARQIIEELQDAVKSIEQNHRDIENHRQLAIQELKNLSVTLIENVERNTQETKEFRFDDYVKRVKQLARESDERIKAERIEVKADSRPLNQPEKPAKPEVNKSVAPPRPVPEAKTLSEPPKTEEVRKRIIQSKEVAQPDERATIANEAPPSLQKTTSPANSTKEEKSEKVITTSASFKTEEKKEKTGPKVAKTISFFDELDTDS